MGVNGIDGISVSPRPLQSSSANYTAQPMSGAVQTSEARVVAQPEKGADTSGSNLGNQRREGFETLKAAVEKTQEFVNLKTNDIQFSLDEDLSRMVVKVIDKSTKDVIRQIPSEEMLEIAKALERLQGLLVKEQA